MLCYDQPIESYLRHTPRPDTFCADRDATHPACRVTTRVTLPPMKILLTEWYREWRGTEPQLLKPAALALDDDKILFALVVSVGNCDYDEVCIETDSMEAKECIRNILCGTGNATPVERSSGVEHCVLYRGL